MIPSHIACLAFTPDGLRLAEEIRAKFPGAVEVLTKTTYKSELPRVFAACGGLVFISSTGIAVRLCAPLLQDKTRDPAVVVVDDAGRYAISLLSGHLGGANALATRIAGLLGAMPIITTASDRKGFEAVDLLAQRYHLVIENLDAAKTITALMVADVPVALISEIPVTWNYPHVVAAQAGGCVYITSQERIACEQPHCVLRPPTLNVGIGCRRGKRAAEILAAIHAVFKQHNLSVQSIKAVASIDLKHDEPGLVQAAATLQRPLKFYSHDEIRHVQGQFSASAFVRARIGVSAVCEPCACLAGGELIVGKTIVAGVTVAVARTRFVHEE